MKHKLLRFLQRLIFSLLALLLLTILVFAGAEAWLRATSCYGSPPSTRIYVAHPLLGWIGWPNADVVRSMPTRCAQYRYNRFGFRGPDLPLVKPPEAIRIVVLGDSFLEGYHFPDEDLLTTHLERLVAKKTNRPVQVINLGISGWGTAQELLSYQQLGRRFQPDVVVLLYSSCNDIINDSRPLSDIYNEKMRSMKPYFNWVDGKLQLTLPPRRLVRAVNRQLTKRAAGPVFSPWELMTGFPSYLCRSRFGYWLYTRWDRPSRLRLLLDAWGLAPFNERLYSTTWGESGYYHGLSLRFWIYSRIPDPLWRAAVEVQMKLVERLAAVTAENQAQFLFVSGANVEQVDPDIWQLTLRTQPSLQYYNLDLDFPENATRVFAAQRGISYLPLVPAFRAAQTKGRELFLRGDGHWNESGQRLAAETIADFLVERGFVAPAP